MKSNNIIKLISLGFIFLSLSYPFVMFNVIWFSEYYVSFQFSYVFDMFEVVHYVATNGMTIILIN